MNRRRFFGVTAALAVPGALYALVTRNAEACGTHARAAGGADADAEPRHAGHEHASPEHPEPRPDVTAERVLPDDQVPERHRKAYAAARAHPAVLDGLYCHCDCGERDGMRSLLSCFESKMPQTCGICRGEAEMAAKLAADGKTLTEIRAAVDKRWG
jgi:hypothetical protein